MAKIITAVKGNQTILVHVADDGSTRVETKGFAGAACLKETAALEAALGGDSKVERTRDFYQTATQSQKARG